MEANWIQIQTQTTSPMWIVIQIQIRIQDLHAWCSCKHAYIGMCYLLTIAIGIEPLNS